MTGTVTGVGLGTTPTIFIDGESYNLTQLMSIGSKEKAETEEQV